MKVNRFELVKKFELLLPAVGFNAMLPEFQRFRISGSTICAYDGALQIVTFLSTDLGFSGSIPAQEFFNVLSSLNDEEVDLMLDRTTNKLILKTPKITAEFSLTPYKPLKEVEPVNTPLSVEALPGGIQPLIDKLVFCQSCVAKDETAGIFCGVLLDRGYVASSDKYRICRSEYLDLFNTPKDRPVSIPSRFIDLLVKYKDKLDLLGLGDERRKLFALCKDGTLMAITLYADEYQNIHELFPEKTSSCHIIELTPEIFDAITHHVALLKHVNTIDQEILIQFKNHQCIVSSELPQTAKLIETFDTPADWELAFYVNPTYVNDINQKMNTPTQEGQPAENPILRYFTDEGRIISIRGENEYLITPRG